MAIAQRLPSGAAPPSRVRQYLRRAWGGGALTVVDGEAVIFSGVDGTLTKGAGAKPMLLPSTVPVVSGNAALFDGTTGIRVKDAGYVPMAVPSALPVVGNDIAIFDSTTGLRIKDSGAQLGPTVLASGSFGAVASLALTGLAITWLYPVLLLRIIGASSDTATRYIQVQASTNNGSTYDTTAADYIGNNISGTTVTNWADATLVQYTAVAAANVHRMNLWINGLGRANGINCWGHVNNGTSNFEFESAYIVDGALVNALKVLWNGSGNFDAGTYELVGWR